MTEDETTTSKDRFFQQLAQLSDAMIEAHGKDFSMGALVLAARFIAGKEGRACAAETDESPSTPSENTV